MSSLTPQKLLEEFKKSGEFDRLRKELFNQFNQSDDNLAVFKQSVDERARSRLAKDNGKLWSRSTEEIVPELLEDIERYPDLDRAFEVADSNSDSTTKDTIRAFIEKALVEKRTAEVAAATDTTTIQLQAPTQNSEKPDLKQDAAP